MTDIRVAEARAALSSPTEGGELPAWKELNAAFEVADDAWQGLLLVGPNGETAYADPKHCRQAGIATPEGWRALDCYVRGQVEQSQVAVEKLFGPLARPTPAAAWDAAQIKQPGWHHVQQAFLDGAREARANPSAQEADFARASDGYTKRVFEEVDPVSEAALRTENWKPTPAAAARQPLAVLASFAHEVVLGAYSEDELPDAAMRSLKRAGLPTLDAARALSESSPAAAAGVPPTAMDFASRNNPPLAVTQQWIDGWDACRGAMLAASGAPAGAPREQKEGSVHQAAPQTSNEQQSLVHQSLITSSVPKGVHSGEAPASAPLAGGSAQ